MRITIVSIAVLFLGSLTLQAQSALVATTNAKKSIQIAQNYINKGDYKSALKQLKHTLKLKEDFAVAHLELGRVNLELFHYQESKAAFEKSFELNPNLSRAAYYECSEACFQAGEIELAKTHLEKFRSMKDGNYANAGKENPTEKLYEILYEERRTSYEFLLKGDYPKHDASSFQSLGNLINSPTDEYLPTLTSDGEVLVFTRTRPNGNQDVMEAYYSNNQWNEPIFFDESINTSENEGMARFSADNSQLFFAGCMREDTEGGCDLYWAQYDDGSIKNVERIDGNLNSEAWDSQPSITCNTKTIFFSSTRDGGYGSADIYFSTMTSNGNWSFPENMGPKFNTAGDEEAPFISSDGNTLYFTSTGLPGMGDGDIFISRKIDGNWTAPQNMGTPINSQGKELGFYVLADGVNAYFSSARQGGQGGLDIYQVPLPQEFRPEPVVHVEGFVKNGATGSPVSCMIDVIRAESKYTVQSDDNGKFFICLPANKAFSFQTQPLGFEYYISAEFFESNDNKQSRAITMELEPTRVKAVSTRTKTREIKERRVQFFFPFDSYDLTKETMLDLDKLITLLAKETWWQVEVIGLADNTGSAAYNMSLSEKRAKVIGDYLQQSGVKTEQVFQQGKGSGGAGKLSRRVDVRLYR